MSTLLPDGTTRFVAAANIVVLASQSPNRLKLIRQMGIEPIVRISNVNENLSKSLPVRDYVEQTAKLKLSAVMDEMNKNEEKFDVIIAADTVIYFEGCIIGKPKTSQDAIDTLKRLRGKYHSVYSGVSLAFTDGTQELFSEKTIVKFGDYFDKTIEKYVASGEPLSCAGSYGISQQGTVFVEKIEGCFSNVVGLPIHKLYTSLSQKDII